MREVRSLMLDDVVKLFSEESEGIAQRSLLKWAPPPVRFDWTSGATRGGVERAQSCAPRQVMPGGDAPDAPRHIDHAGPAPHVDCAPPATRGAYGRLSLLSRYRVLSTSCLPGGKSLDRKSVV